MPTRDAISWFKQQFQSDINNALNGTPFSLDLLAAIASQETGYIWNTTRRYLPVTDVLQLCVGDSIDDTGGRSAFPRNKTALLAKTNGAQMFQIARKCLVDVSQYVTSYRPAASNPNKFCHGFGIFQYDLQFFLDNSGYFLRESWADFRQCLALCVSELTTAQGRLALRSKTILTDLEMSYVAIAYNKGSFNPAKGLKQGYKDDGKYYGENIYDFLRLSQSVSALGGAVVAQPLVAPTPGKAPLPPPSPIEAAGSLYEVETAADPLNLRESADVTRGGQPTGKIIARLPDGFLVRGISVSGKKNNGFLEVETSIRGGLKQGWAFAKYLKPAPAGPDVPVHAPTAVPPATGIVAVYAPRAAGSITKRTQTADAHSLNEDGQPGRKGTTPADLCVELEKIIDWLAVDDSRHSRYHPHDGITYCNIYVHDYCHLAGVYLPRVWWSHASIAKLIKGESVEPKVDSTVDEQRANDLFRWLRDFGLTFGWRQTGTVTKMQDEVNLGAIGIIVARRREDGRSGHIVGVVPENGQNVARRNASGQIITPLQSQAGSTNFKYGTGKVDWWLGGQFAESAFWIHS
jgi:hypothetical protein